MVLAAQAEIQDELEDAKHNAPWVDITQGMELSERLEHELELWGWMQLLDPSHPKALNFNEEQSFKSLGMAGTNTSLYTFIQMVSLGGTAFEPQDNNEVDSQESSIFGSSDSSEVEDNLEHSALDHPTTPHLWTAMRIAAKMNPMVRSLTRATGFTLRGR